MLSIDLPSKESLNRFAIKEHIKNTIDDLIDSYSNKELMEVKLEQSISTMELFDKMVGIHLVVIKILKVEENRTLLKRWEEAIKDNSGGEGFVTAFILFITLMTYARKSSLFEGVDSKVLIMDNPFAQTTSNHLLEPMFEIAKKYDTQLICLTDITLTGVVNKFGVIYLLRKEKEVGRNREYLAFDIIKDEEDAKQEKLTSSIFHVEKKKVS